jgi:hypothetical protein
VLLLALRPELKVVDRFQAEDSPIWRVTWAPARYGAILAVACYKKRVSLWQQAKTGWQQIAENTEH